MNYGNNVSVHLSPWLAGHVTKQFEDLVALARGTCVAATGRGFLYLRFNYNCDRRQHLPSKRL
jgi:hypothetical protein